MQKPIIFLGYLEDQDKVISCIKKLSRLGHPQPLVVSSNLDTEMLSGNLDCEVISFDRFLSEQDCRQMDAYVFQLAENWYLKLPPVEGRTQYHQIQLGKLVELEAQRLFSHSIKNLEIALKIIDRFSPEEIIFIEQKGQGSFKGLAKFIKNTFKISTRCIQLSGENGILLKLFQTAARFIIDFSCHILDSCVVMLADLRREKRNLILMDYKLIDGLKDTDQGLSFFPFVVENGLNVRWNLLKRKELFFGLSKYRYLASFPATSLFFKNLIFCRSLFNNRLNFKYKNFVIDQTLEQDLRRLVVYNFPRLYKTAVFTAGFIKRINPQLIVLREAIRDLMKTLTLVAKQQGIPTLVLQHGATNEVNVYTRLNSDYIALWGEAGRQWYRSYGNDVSGVRITGNPGHDRAFSFLTRNIRAGSGHMLREIGADPGKATIVHLATLNEMFPLLSVYYTQDYSLLCLKAVLASARQHPDKQFIIKPHPFYNRLFHPVMVREIKRHPNVFLAKTDVNLLELFDQSSIVMSEQFSSALILALILGKPLISLNFFKRKELMPLAERKVALEVRKSEELPGAITRIFADRNLCELFEQRRQSFIGDYAYKIDGQATRRVGELIRTLSNGKKKKSI